MRLHTNMSLPLLVMVLLSYVYVEAALLRKSAAADFLKHGQQRRTPRCLQAGCSMEDSEAEELLEANSAYEESSKTKPNGGSKPGQNLGPDSAGEREEGSGM